MPDQQNLTSTQAATFLEKLFGPSERTVVLVVDENRRLVDYSVDDLNAVIATLSLNGFGQPVQDCGQED